MKPNMDHSTYYAKTELLKMLLLKYKTLTLEVILIQLLVSRRTFHRMLEDLRKAGYQIDYNRKRNEYTLVISHENPRE